MTSISAPNVIPQTGGLTEAAGGASAANVDFDTFLSLLVAQLANQDPLDPLDPNEFTGQLAQYSQIEQQVQANSFLETIAGQSNFGEQSLAVSYIGREALVPSQSIVLNSDGGEVEFGFELEGAASTALVQIRDSNGVLVRELNGTTTNGLNLLTFDGNDTDGEALPAGEYSVIVSASDFDGRLVEANPYAYVKVNAVQSSDSGIDLVLDNDTRVDFSQAEIVREPLS